VVETSQNNAAYQSELVNIKQAMKHMREVDGKPPPLKIKINKQPAKEKPKKNIVV
jgi:hypothetical protein